VERFVDLSFKPAILKVEPKTIKRKEGEMTSGILVSKPLMTEGVPQFIEECNSLIGVGTVIYPVTYLRENNQIGEENVIINSKLEEVKTGEGCYIENACILESELKNDVVIEGARVEKSKVGNRSHLGFGAAIKNCELGAEVHIPHFCYLGNALIGEKSNIAAGVVTCNYDGLRKHQTKIGKRCFIGGGVYFIAPCEVGDEVFISATVTILPESVIPNHALVFGNGKSYKINQNRSFYFDGIGWVITYKSLDAPMAEKVLEKIKELKRVVQDEEKFVKLLFLPFGEPISLIEMFRDLNEANAQKIIDFINKTIQSPL